MKPTAAPSDRRWSDVIALPECEETRRLVNAWVYCLARIQLDREYQEAMRETVK